MDAPEPLQATSDQHTQIAVKSRRLSPAEHLTALQLHEQEQWSIVKIAERLGRDRETISRALDGFADTKELAAKWLSGQALELARHLTTASEVGATKGRHEAALAALERIGVVDAPAQGNGGARVNIVIGAPGAPITAQIMSTNVVEADGPNSQK